MEMTLLDSIRGTIQMAMRDDPQIVVLGEDVGINGGVFRATDGLQKEFGEERVIDTPLSESGIIGFALGMAVLGIKPICEIQFMDFIYPAFDQIVSEVAKIRYRSGGEWFAPMVIRTPYGGGIRGGHYHSQSSESYFTHTSGLKVVVPSNPYDARGLLFASLLEEDPVLFLEPKKLYRSLKGEVPDKKFIVPLSKAHIVRKGKDATIISWGSMVSVCMEGALLCEKNGIDCEVIDVRTLSPLDEESILNSVKKTSRAVIVHEAPKNTGFGAEISARIAEKALLYLDAPIVRVCGFDTPFPYTLEHVYLPHPERIRRAVEGVVHF